MRFQYLVGTLSIALLLVSCETKELPVPARQMATSQIEMGGAYEYQVFYNLSTDSVISKNLKWDWDLGFECSPDGFRVILNSSKLMYAAPTDKEQLEQVKDTSGYEVSKHLDASSGNKDSTAIGDWRINKPVYIINRGLDGNGTTIGFVKLKITEVTAQNYVVNFQDLDGGPLQTITIPKNENYNFSFLSFEGAGKIVSIEPPKDLWDLCFTQYSATIPIDYLVTGVLLNRYQTEAYVDSINLFENISLDQVQEASFSSRLDMIGYDWKSYNFTSGMYDVNALKNFIIRTKEQFYYKMHFLDFYNTQGQKGSPKWEYSRL